MTIVDAHVHMGVPFRPAFGNAVGYTAEAVIRDLDRAGVDMAVILGIPHVQDNEYTAASAEKYPDRLIPWAYIDPWQFTDPREAIRRFADMGFVGAKFRSVGLRYTLADRPLLDPYFDACRDYGLFVSMHTGDDASATPLQVQEMALAFPEVTILMVHCGFRMVSQEAISVAKRCSNIIMDQTAATSWQLREALEAVGPERVIYGSDAPFMDTRVEMKRFEVAISDPHVRELTMGGNILRLLNRS